MTERQGNEFDDPAAPPPHPRAGSADSVAGASGPLPRPHHDEPEPPLGDQTQWGPPPPPGPNGVADPVGAPESTDDAAYQWPNPAGVHRAGPLDNSTVVDHPGVRVPERLRERVDTPGPVPPAASQRRAPGELHDQTPPPPAQPGRAQQAQHDASGPAAEHALPSFTAPPPAGPGGYPERPSPSWQQPPPQQQSAGSRSEDNAGWTQAQGSAANWNYVDSIRSSELVPTRRIPPGGGWRKAVYHASFKLVNPGQSPDERYRGELEDKIRSLLRGTYKIGVLGKGGVGKSTISAGVGSVFAELRQDDRVVAIDADTAFGKLGIRIDPAASGSYWELAADRQLFTFGDIRSRVGSNTVGLFVLAGESATARRRVLDPAIYREATAQLDKHFTLSIVDCGSTLDSPVTREVLGDLDALIVVSSPWYDGASAAGQTLDWLANGGYTSLLHRTVVVVNDSDGHAAKRDRQLLMERFGGRGQKVIEMPYDEHLRPGGVIDVKGNISRLTRRRLMELAAACAEHFAATTDRPRGA